MLIVNRYSVGLTGVTARTANTAGGSVDNLSTSSDWYGINPPYLSGATGNAAAGSVLWLANANDIYSDQVISKLVQVNVSIILTGGQANYIKVPLNNLDIPQNKVIQGIYLLGVYDPNATENNNTPTVSLMCIAPDFTNTSPQIAAYILKDNLIFKIHSNSTALAQGKVISAMLYYSKI